MVSTDKLQDSESNEIGNDIFLCYQTRNIQK